MIGLLRKYLTPNQMEQEVLEDRNCDRRMVLIKISEYQGVKNWKKVALNRDDWAQILKKARAYQGLSSRWWWCNSVQYKSRCCELYFGLLTAVGNVSAIQGLWKDVLNPSLFNVMYSQAYFQQHCCWQTSCGHSDSLIRRPRVYFGKLHNHVLAARNIEK